MQRLLLLGLNHTTAPLEVRERLAFNATARQNALEDFKRRFPDSEIVILSTCNRVELYAARPVHDHPTLSELVDFLADFHAFSPAELEPHLYRKTNRDVVEHLFSVSSSLDSMVLGETQILGQVREAYEAAMRLQLTGASLNPLFQRAIGVGKQIMHETPLAEGRVSVASVAVDYARQIFERFDDKTVLCIGGGKMAALVLQTFVALSPGSLLICNRSSDRALSLAARFNGRAASFEQLADHLVAADIVVTSTGATQPIITRAQFETILKRRRYRPIFIIDIAFPRDVEPGVGELDHVYLYNLDDLQGVVVQTRSQRQDASAAARQIVMKQVEEYSLWHRQRELGPTIQKLYERYHALAQEELNRTVTKLPNISAAERTHLEELARRIVNKLLHDPIHTLRNADAGHGPNIQYLHALEKLFQLEGGSIPPSPGTPGEGRGGGDFEDQARSSLENTLTPALSRSTGRGGQSLEGGAMAPSAGPGIFGDEAQPRRGEDDLEDPVAQSRRAGMAPGTTAGAAVPQPSQDAKG
jgi:glutamyl-tRNA reductase